MTYYINGIQVHENTYNQYLEKEFKRLKANCRYADWTPYEVYKNKILLNDILFEVR